MADVTPRTPGLDPERVELLARGLRLEYDQQLDWWDFAAEARSYLAADDAYARSRGLVATGDGLTRKALVGLRRLLAGWEDDEEGWPGVEGRLSFDQGYKASWRERADELRAALAALPSSLLDNPEADRG